MGAGVTKATKGQSDLKAVHELQQRGVFTSQQAGREHQPPRVFVFKLRGRVRIGDQNLFTKCVRIGNCLSQRVFESRDTTVHRVNGFL